MKTLWTACVLAGLVLIGGGADAAPSSAKLLLDGDRYPVVYTDGHMRVYADMHTVERDYAAAGTLPVIRATLYGESYVSPMTYPHLGNYDMVSRIVEYSTAVGAQFDGSKMSYAVMSKVQGTYNPDGKAGTGGKETLLDNDAEEAETLYLSLYRLSRP